MSTAPAAGGAPGAADEDVHWTKCPGCGGLLYLKRLERNLRVCPECRHHLRLGAEQRLELLLDAGSFAALPGGEPASRDVLGFTDKVPYPQRLAAARRRTGRTDAALAGTGTVEGRPLVVLALDFGFLGGSMGAAVGELVARAARHALAERLPLLLVSASGGARMQEGTVSLMQMAKTAQWIARLREAGLACVNLNTDPTFGGVTASFAMLGDVVLAEPGALVGFAGPQVIRTTIRQELPPGFQTAEFLRDKGMVDLVVPREAQRATIARLLRLLGPCVPELPERGSGAAVVTDPARLSPRPPRETVTLARRTGRPTTTDYLGHVFDDYLVLAGDRAYGDDPALVAGIGRAGGQSVVFLGHQKGHTTAELVAANFGMPHPEGYRKAHRLMRLAERFGLPVVAFVDTPGAYPGIGAEERGQAVAIAECILELSRLPVPVVTVVTGEGGSGGALALGVADRVLVLENAYYSVISPEGASTILFGSAEHAGRTAEALRLRAADLLRLRVADGVVPEPPGGAHDDPFGAAANVRRAVLDTLAPLLGTPGGELVDARRARFEAFGHPHRQAIVDWEDEGRDDD